MHIQIKHLLNCSFQDTHNTVTEVVHKNHTTMSPSSLNMKWQAGDIHESFREQKKYCKCSLVTTHQMHESALLLKDHLCKEPFSFDGKWQAKDFRRRTE